MKPIAEIYVVTLNTLPGDSRPGVVRLRQLLKLARRACGLRCVRLGIGKASVESQNTAPQKVTP